MDYTISSQQHFEASRFFRITFQKEPRSGWYYQAREGTFGPFTTEIEAEKNLRRMVEKNPHRRLEVFRRLGLEVSRP